MLQVGKVMDSIPDKVNSFSIYLLLPTALWATRPPTKLNARDLLEVRGRQARKVDNLTAIYELIV
jgi:hypothetical protein